MKRFILFLSLISLILFGCTVTINGVDTPSYSDIKISSTTDSISVDDTLTLTVSATDGRNLNKIHWEIEDESIATRKQKSISDSLTIVGLKKGTTIIKATEDKTDKSTVITINVTEKKYSDIYIASNQNDISVDEQIILTIHTKDNRKLNKINFTITSGNTNVSIIDNSTNGTLVLKGLSEGEVNVVAEEENTGKTHNITFRINKKVLSDISITSTKNELKVGEELTLKVVTSDNRTLDTITFNVLSGNENISIVNNETNGTLVIKGEKKGDVLITASEANTNKSISVHITVKNKEEITYSEIKIESNKNELIVDEELTLNIVTTDNRILNEITFNVVPSENIQIISSTNDTITIKALKKGKVTITASEAITNKSSSYVLNIKEKEYSNIKINANKTDVSVNDEITFTISTTDSRKLNNITFAFSPAEKIQEVNKNINGSITVKLLSEGDITINAKEDITNKTARFIITVKPQKQITPKYYLNIGTPGDTGTLIPNNITLTKEDYKIDVRAFDYETRLTPVSLSYVSVKGLPNDLIENIFINTDKKVSPWGTTTFILTIRSNKIDFDRQVKITIEAGFEDGSTLVSDVYSITKIKEDEQKPTPDPHPNPDPTPDIKPGTSGNEEASMKIFDSLIIPKNYDTEKVVWLGGITPPLEKDFEDYNPTTGKDEVEMDGQGNIIEGTTIKGEQVVPRYYIHENLNYDYENAPGSTWYNVNKSYIQDAQGKGIDKNMCWAMSAASALHWWFDTLGKDYTDKLFYIRRNRKDMKEPSFMFDKLNAKDIHYTPTHSQESNDIHAKSGIGQYVKKSFRDVGGQSANLFRLFFYDENEQMKKSTEGNYLGGRMLGLLHGAQFGWGGTGGPTDAWENLFKVEGLTDRQKNDIVNVFKQAIKDNCAIVIHQANIPDTVPNEQSNYTKAAHAIIVWGVIFDESMNNIVGLYVGDNNLRDSSLTRVDLVYKKLTDKGGRYYYASPIVDQSNPKYVKQTSLYGMTLLYPPTDSLKVWIDQKYDEVYKEMNKK